MNNKLPVGFAHDTLYLYFQFMNEWYWLDNSSFNIKTKHCAVPFRNEPLNINYFTKRMIKPLTADHLDAFIKIRMDSLKLHPDAFGAAYEEGIDREKTRMDLSQKNEENFILGYFQDDVLIGMVGFIREQRLKKKHKAMIWCVFVYPEYRNKGIARQLLTACIKKAEKLPGLERIVLTVSHKATSAQKLYKSLGFEAFGREPEAMKINGYYVDEIYMSRTLKRTDT